MEKFWGRSLSKFNSEYSSIVGRSFEGEISQNLTVSKYSNVVQGSFEEDFSQNLPMTIEGMSKDTPG